MSFLQSFSVVLVGGWVASLLLDWVAGFLRGALSAS